MKLLVVQISDIHIKDGKNSSPDRFPLVAAALQNLDVEIACILVIGSGDVAFSGIEAEYKIAAEAFKALRASLSEKFEGIPVHFVAIPGNHDCDLQNSKAQARSLILNGLGRTSQTPDHETLALCCCVHENFFAFLKNNETIHPHAKSGDVFYEYIIPVGSAQIQVRCFNTAFASTKPEVPGQLYYPTVLLATKALDPAPIYSIAVFHHPYNWLTPETKRVFSEHMEKHADLILTGHEHQTAYYKKESYSGLRSNFIEAPAFQESNDPDQCGFNAILVDFTTTQERLVSFQLEDGYFAKEEISSGYRPFRRSVGRHDFELTEAMLSRLEDPGTAYTHPGKPRLLIEDIFVPPDAEELRIENEKDLVRTGRVDSRKLITTIAERKKVLVIGRERSGKSTLCKVLFRHFYHQGFLPVLIEGDHIRSDALKGDGFLKLVRKRVQEDYSNPMLDKFDQFERDKTVILIDDFDHSALNARGRLKLLEGIQKHYVRIVVLGDDLLRLEELANGDLGAKILADYTQYEIKEYGHVLRSALIDKWYDVNHEYATNPDLLAQMVTAAERAIDDVIRKSYLPSYPVFILTMLQGFETAQPISNSAGSYGYLYQVLITDQLVKTSPEISLDKKLSYLVELAYHMFKRRQRELSEPEYQVFHTKYCADYVSIDRAKIFGALESAGLLETYDKHVRFKYAYFYYYFVAQYFARNLEDETVRKSVVALCDDLQKEEHANIWLFLTHQSRSNFLLETIIKHATTFFSEIAPPEFKDDVAFLQDLYNQVPELVLENKTPDQMRQERRKKLDEEREAHFDEDEDQDEHNEVLKTIIKMRAAVRTLEVMGQIVKNFAGSMKGDPRFTLVNECYRLGLRVVGVIFQQWKQDGEAFVQEIMDVVLQKETDIEDREELETMIKSCIFYFCETVAQGMIKRISHAVGTKDLADTYPKVLNANSSNAYHLIDLSVKLDTLGFPTEQVYELNDKFKENIFCKRLLARLVINHFYLFSTSDRIKQQVCSKLGIKISQLRGIDVKTESQKRLPGTTD